MLAGADRILALRAKRGDMQAFERLVQSYQQLAFRAAFLITGQAQDAEDAVQDAFLKAYYGLSQFRAGAAFKPWLMRIVTNEALNRTRSRSRYVSLTLRAADDTFELDGSPSPEAIVISEEQQVRVLHALSALAEDDRIVLGYRYLLELSVVEIAAALSCPPSTVRSRHSRALRRLRSELDAGRGQRRLSSDEVGFKEAPHG